MPAFTSIALGIAAAAAVGGGVMQANAASKAAKAQQAAANDANSEARRQFDLQRSDLAPWRETGKKALSTVSGAYGLGTSEENNAAKDAFFNASPDYNFGLDQGKRAVEGTLGAGGMGRFGGGALKALTRYGQDYATTRFGNWRSGLEGVAGVGQQAVNAGNQASRDFSTAYGQNTRAAGDARASSYLGKASAYGGILSDVGQLGMYGAGKGWFTPKPNAQDYVGRL